MRRMNFIEARTRAGRWGARLAWFGLFVAIAGVLVARLGDVGPGPVLAVIGAGWVISGVALLLSLAGIVAVWREGLRGAPAAFTGLLVACVALLWPGIVGVQFWRTPGLAEFTTDTLAPPEFTAATQQLAAAAGTALGAPRANERLIQQGEQLNVLPLFMDQQPAEALKAVANAARAMGWRITVVSEAPEGGGQVEAIARSDLLRFPQYVVARIRPTADGSQLDVRVVSQYGALSPGTNLRRIIDLHETVQGGDDG